MMGDLLDFTCPYYASESEPMYQHDQEHYIIYQVSRQEYETCNYYADSASLMIVNCSKPRRLHRYTIYFDDFIAAPNAPEFKSGETYYYITTSTGYKDGLTNTDMEKGACHTRNMRLSIKVCCDSTTSPTPLLPTNSTGGGATPPTPPLPSSTAPSAEPPVPSSLADVSSTAPTTTSTSRPRPSTRRQHHSTVRWRATTARYPDKPGGGDKDSVKPSAKPADKDNSKGENDTDNPQTGGQGGINSSATLSVSVATVVIAACFCLLHWTR